MSTVKMTTKFRFENMNDYVRGLTGLVETLQIWQERADKGYERKYEITEHSDEFKVEVAFQVTPHEI
jgi:hypothetical protein